MNTEKSYRILIVDDNAAIHEDFRKILGSDSSITKLDADEAAIFGGPSKASPSTEFKLSFASQGQEALSLTQHACQAGERFSLVFMDVRMPPGWD
jgi:two-component system NtrC family sensor kinase